MESNKSDYERKRDARVADNLQRLEALGLAQARSRMAAAGGSGAAKAQKRKQREQVILCIYYNYCTYFINMR